MKQPGRTQLVANIMKQLVHRHSWKGQIQILALRFVSRQADMNILRPNKQQCSRRMDVVMPVFKAVLHVSLRDKMQLIIFMRMKMLDVIARAVYAVIRFNSGIHDLFGSKVLYVQ